MPTWVIKRVEALDMHDAQDLADDDEPLFVERFSNDNDFAAALHESGIVGVVQDDDDKEDDNDNGDRNTDEDPDKPLRISLEPAADHRKNSGVSPPENPMELPGVAHLITR